MNGNLNKPWHEIWDCDSMPWCKLSTDTKKCKGCINIIDPSIRWCISIKMDIMQE